MAKQDGAAEHAGIASWATEEDVAAVSRTIREEARTRHLGEVAPPALAQVETLIGVMRELVFPGFFGNDRWSETSIEKRVRRLMERAGRACHDIALTALVYSGMNDAEAEARSAQVTREFLAQTPEIRARLAEDAQAAHDGDPAAKGIEEVILAYPGVQAVLCYRVAHALHLMGVPFVPRLIGEKAHRETGIDIHPGARIGRSFFVDHGTGVTIGEEADIGDHVKIYQGVTLGAKSFPVDEFGRIIRGQKRHPTIEDRVVIYADAVVLGGDTVIGADSIVSGGVCVTQSTPKGHIVRQKGSELIFRTNREIRG